MITRIVVVDYNVHVELLRILHLRFETTVNETKGKLLHVSEVLIDLVWKKVGQAL